MEYTDINAETIDRWVEGGWEWGVPLTHEKYLEARNGALDLLLTPTKFVPRHWYPELAGCRVLGLAAGGAQQMPVFAAHGAVCTVLDYSERQLQSEREVAAREGYDITIVRADMSRPLPFADGQFDLIFHPVANCYIEQVLPLWRECFRVLRPGGRLLAGMDNGVNYLFQDEESGLVTETLPFNPLKNPAQMEELRANDEGVQFSHTLEEQIRGQLQAGFRLLDLYEDTNGSGFLHRHNVPTFWATLAEKPL